MMMQPNANIEPSYAKASAGDAKGIPNKECRSEDKVCEV